MRSLCVRILGERGAVVGLMEWAVVDGVGGHELSFDGGHGGGWGVGEWVM